MVLCSAGGLPGQKTSQLSDDPLSGLGERISAELTGPAPAGAKKQQKTGKALWTLPFQFTLPEGRCRPKNHKVKATLAPSAGEEAP